MIRAGSRAGMDGQRWGCLCKSPHVAGSAWQSESGEGTRSCYKHITGEGRRAISAKGCCWRENGWGYIGYGYGEERRGVIRSPAGYSSMYRIRPHRGSSADPTSRPRHHPVPDPSGQPIPTATERTPGSREQIPASCGLEYPAVAKAPSHCSQSCKGNGAPVMVQAEPRLPGHHPATGSLRAAEALPGHELSKQ